MNEHFISKKVDREERPDVDQVYMNAAQLITGSGGRPLNAFRYRSFISFGFADESPATFFLLSRFCRELVVSIK